MISPGSNAFYVSLVVLIIVLYFLFFKKESRKEWGTLLNFTFYFGLVVTSIVVIWGLVYIFITVVVG